MKTITLAIAAILISTIVSCRQSDEVYSTENVSTVDMMEKSKKTGKEDFSSSVKRDSINFNDNSDTSLDGQIVPPPRK